MAKITKIYAREILDSRGNPTVEVKVTLEGDIEATSSVPSGASTGVHEALELRDGDKSRFGGKGVLKACKNVNTVIARALVGMDVSRQKEIDKIMIELDGTENKSKLGANAILGVSLASARAAAKSQGCPLYGYISKTYQLTRRGRFSLRRTVPKTVGFTTSNSLPTPMFNIINGGKHADSDLDIQEFMIVPVGLKTFREKFEAGKKIFQKLKELLEGRGYSLDIGDEGGFAPKLKESLKAFEILVEAIAKAGYSPGQDVSLAIDAAASEFFKDGKYLFEGEELSSEEMIEVYKSWLEKYPLISIEDGLSEDDWSGWQKLGNGGSGASTIMLVGDDLFTTNIKRLKKGIDLKVANAILIKPNQIGTLSETVDCIKLAKENNYQFIISHRSGETPDDFIADLAVAVGAGFIKAGAPNPARRERMVKYERLLEIEEELGQILFSIF